MTVGVSASQTDAVPGAVRTESDALGSVDVPAQALYGVHTVRALRAYPLPGPSFGEFTELLDAYAAVKSACATTNEAFGLLDTDTAEAIRMAAVEVRSGTWNQQFPSKVLQGGGGVSTNMNLNEVLANRASELLGGFRGEYTLVHPNDHVNRSQSTNDTYPTAILISTSSLLLGLVATLESTAGALVAKGREYRGTLRLGRTCLRDALPVDIFETHTAQAALVQRSAERVRRAAISLHHVPLGATAVGTGAGAPADFGLEAVAVLRTETGLPLVLAENPYDALSNLDVLTDVGHAVAEAGAALARIAKDLRLLSSGPHAGFDELHLPPVSAGSSIMPGKTNPAIPELVMQVAMEMLGIEHVVAEASRAGELELNVMEPIIVSQLHPGIKRLTMTAEVFAKQCIAGIEWRLDTLKSHLSGSYLEKVERSSAAGYASVAQAGHAANTGPALEDS